jgi:hypothetical protein
VALSVEFTKTTPLIPQANFIQWTLKGVAPQGDYWFDLYRSGSMHGPWEPVASKLKNVYCYVDKFPQPATTDPTTFLRPNHLAVTRNFFYRLTAVCTTGESAEDVTELTPTLAPKQKQLLRKLIHDEYIQLRKYTGVPVAVLKRKQWGARCVKCVDKITKEILRAHCTDCWGTGFLGGYWNPILTYARRAPLQTNIQVAPENKVESTTARFMMLNIPRVEQSDVVVFLSDGRRFVVDQQSETSLRTVAVHQTVFALELPRSHIIYRFPVDETTVPPLM